MEHYKKEQLSSLGWFWRNHTSITWRGFHSYLSWFGDCYDYLGFWGRYNLIFHFHFSHSNLCTTLATTQIKNDPWLSLCLSPRLCKQSSKICKIFLIFLFDNMELEEQLLLITLFVYYYFEAGYLLRFYPSFDDSLHNLGKRYGDDLELIFDQWSKFYNLHWIWKLKFKY